MEVGATPKRATSIPKDLSGSAESLGKKEGSPSRLQRPASKESLSEKGAESKKKKSPEVKKESPEKEPALSKVRTVLCKYCRLTRDNL